LRQTLAEIHHVVVLSALSAEHEWVQQLVSIAIAGIVLPVHRKLSLSRAFSWGF
jgi:hypothetical protein